MDTLQRYRLMQAGIKAVNAALVAEAGKRHGRSFEEWCAAESQAVWTATRDFALQHGLRVPTIAEIVRVESQACGHSDYASKWALYAVELTLVQETVSA